MNVIFSCLYDITLKSRADRIVFGLLLLFMLALMTALRLNDHWAEQRQTISSGVIGCLVRHSGHIT